ncbi:enolase C-terminal domain-like protein [Microbacterium sp. GXS0129]|uniref:enolase C-terminal domain-like protein n=1 Tax=Microbacterium sp. GXS0129 TaxID=3377836 RepID=UPI00383A05A6
MERAVRAAHGLALGDALGLPASEHRTVRDPWVRSMLRQGASTVFDYQTLITERLIDYVRSAVTHTGGITAMKKLLDFAAVYGIKSGIHGPTDISPIGMAAALHLDLAIHNFGIQEYMPHNEQTLEVFQTSFTFDRGFLHPGEQPGLGVELNESAAAAFDYTKAYLPVNRLEDGTVHDW